MSGKASVEAPSNIAFIKYWGTRDRGRTLPYNPSISMTLSGCVSRCTVEHREEDGEHGAGRDHAEQHGAVDAGEVATVGDQEVGAAHAGDQPASSRPSVSS